MNNRKFIGTVLYFSIVCFLYTSTMSMLNKDIAAGVDGRHLFLYMLQSFALGAGMFLYPLCRQRLGMSKKASLILLALSSLVCSAGVLFSGYTDDYALIVAIMIIIPISLGYYQGYAFVRFASDMYDEETGGRALGISLGASILLQYVIQIRFDIGILLPILIGIAYPGLAVWEIYTDSREEGEPTSDYDDTGHDRAVVSAPGKDSLRFLTGIVITACCLDILAIYLDGQMERLLDTSDFFSWPRLFYAFGFIAMGFLADIRRIRVDSLAMVIGAVMSVLMPGLLTDSRFWTFDICFFYFYLGFCVVFNTLRFIRYGREHHNIYAAPAYRGIDNILTGFFVLTGFSGLPQLYALVIDTVLVAIVVLIMWMDGSFGRVISSDTRSENSDRMALFAEKYNLTERESEALNLLISKNEKGDAMAREMGVSRRGFVSFTSSIYKKTNTDSRIALLQKYMSE